MNETERLLAAVVDMQHYVTHDVDQGKCAACQRWDELQSAAMAAAGRIDALSAELAALRAELESAHAAQRHAENELSQYMAWYAMAEHQHLHEQRRAEKAEAEAARLRAALRELGKHPEECKAELVAAKALLQSGADVVTRGAQIMTLEQLSTWGGCRGFVEAVFEMCERAALGER